MANIYDDMETLKTQMERHLKLTNGSRSIAHS